jgi:hypothetical protein
MEIKIRVLVFWVMIKSIHSTNQGPSHIVQATLRNLSRRRMNTKVRLKQNPAALLRHNILRYHLTMTDPRQ